MRKLFVIMLLLLGTVTFAQSQGAWTSSSVNGRFVSYCDVTVDSTYYYMATLKTPTGLDPDKPWLLLVNTEAATLDTSTAIEVNVYAGYSSSFALTVSTSTLTVTDGFLVANDVIDDVKSTCIGIVINPTYTGAKTASTLAGVRGIVNLATAPYYGFVINRGTAAAFDYTTDSTPTCRFMIVQ